jgi:hypothetical protein
MAEAVELYRGGEASSDEEEETICHFSVAFWWQMTMLSVVDTRRGPVGSFPGNASNFQRDYGAIHAHYRRSTSGLWKCCDRILPCMDRGSLSTLLSDCLECHALSLTECLQKLSWRLHTFEEDYNLTQPVVWALHHSSK